MRNNLDRGNLNYFSEAKNSLIDPLAREISEDVKWVKLDKKWGSLDYPHCNLRRG